MRSVELPELADLEGADAGKLAILFEMTDRVRAQADAMAAEIATTVERQKLHRVDADSSAAAWVRARRKWSKRSAIVCLQVGRMLQDLPEVRAAFHTGTVGVDQVRELAAVHANPRCGSQLADVEARMLRHARGMSFADFRCKLRDWEAIADPDGAFADRDRINEGRNVRIGFLGEGFALSADGPSLAGSDMKEILDAFADAEFKKDWDDLVARVGAKDVDVSQLARTHLQRRFDALHRIFLQAAAAPPAGMPPIRLGDVVIDHETFRRGLSMAFGIDPGPDDPQRFDEAHCRTVDGVQLDPRDAAMALLWGQVRRVLWTAPGLPTEVGVARRCFTGAVRTAVELLSTHCVADGCETPTSRSQIDHLQPASDHGLTAVANGGPKCGGHNRAHYRLSYHTWRDQHGYWHTARPDGTELGPDWDPWDTS